MSESRGRFDAADVREAARGRWPDILAALAPELREAVDAGHRRHVPCPRHGGKDGYRVLPDVADTGGTVCNTCGTFADGFATLQWVTGRSFADVLADVAGELGMRAKTNGKPAAKTRATAAPAPAATPEPCATAAVQADRERLSRTWSATTKDTGRIAAYLRERGLSGRVPAVLRLHPALDYWSCDKRPQKLGTYPAIVAKVQDGAGLVVNLHRTYLAADGAGKADVPKPKKLMTPVADGATSGAAIRLFDPVDVLAITEGIETALAVHEATGTPAWAAASARGLETVQVPALVKRVELWADRDESGRGQQAAENAAARLHAAGHDVRVLLPPDVGRDWLDVLTGDGADALKQAQAAAEPWRPEPAPAAEPVELAALLDDVAAFLRRFIVFTLPEQAVAVALWVAHTYVFEQADVSPYLAVTSPEKRCGKTRVFEVLELLVHRPWTAADPTAAVLYRKLAQERPTLLLDETDAIFGASGRSSGDRNEELRAVLNAGHRRGTTVTRCAGANRDKLEDFDVYAPKAFAGIGQLPDTVSDRSVIVRMARKAKSETVERYRRKRVEPDGYALRDRLATWAESAVLPDAPDLPDELDDRAQDNWEPLLAIADLAGGDWPAKARHAALVLSAGRTDATESLGVRLLADTRHVFDTAAVDRLKTDDLLGKLAELEESPWGTLHDGHRMRPRKLADLLRPYDVKPANHRFTDGVHKGYLRDDFEDAWERYLEPVAGRETPQEPLHGNNPCKSQENEALHDDFAADHVADQKPAVCRHVTDVADEEAETGGETVSEPAAASYFDAFGARRTKL